MVAILRASGLLHILSAFLYLNLASATFDATSKNNVVVYYGQGPYQKPLSTYCADSSIDVIVLSFVYMFPQQANGFPGINFGNQCSGDVYPGPGYNGVNNSAHNQLLKCPNLQRDLNTCRKTGPGKKILLSLGGGTGTYQLTGATDGTNFASLLWNMFGPGQKQGIPRPFDYNGAAFSVDGFDLDIETPARDSSAGYKALVTELRRLYGTVSGKYYLTASPQCVVPDANLKDMLSVSTWDMLFIQFYNTPQCSARRWADANPNYKAGGAFADAGFTFDAWATWIANTPSRASARLYIGLPGAAAAAASPGNDLTAAQASNLANAYYCRAGFGGVAVWEATYAAGNVAANGRNFYQNVKTALVAASAGAGRCAKTARALPDGRRWE